MPAFNCTTSCPRGMQTTTACNHVLEPGQAHCLKCCEKILYNHRLKLRVALATLLVLAPIWNFPLHYVLAKLGAVDLQWFLFWVYMPLAFEISDKVADRLISHKQENE
jgi:hypothetical protein